MTGSDHTPARGRRKARDKAKRAIGKIPAPTNNPVTNLIITDVILRAGARVMRRGVERAFIGVKHSPDEAQAVLARGSVMKSLASSAVARFATRSPQGAVLVGGALVVKALYDRAQDKKARRKASG